MTAGRESGSPMRNWATELEITVEVLSTILAAQRSMPDWYQRGFSVAIQDLNAPDFVVVSDTTEDGDLVFDLDCDHGDDFELEALSYLTFRNDTESIVRLSFHTDSACQQPAAGFFQLPLYGGAPFLELGPGDEGAATTTKSNGSDTTDQVHIDIHLKTPEGQWASCRGDSGGPDMGINNP